MEDEKYKIGERLTNTHQEMDARCGLANMLHKEILGRYSFILRKFEELETIGGKDAVNIRQIKILLNFLAQLGV